MKKRLPEYRLVICRSDLPENPYWREEAYPGPTCWDPIELMYYASRAGEYSPLYENARRIYWEMYWRGMGRYHHRHPFPEVYFCKVGVGCIRGLPGLGTEENPTVQHIVMDDIIVSAFTFGIAKPGYGLYREIFHKRPLAEQEYR